jgi:hypothetical protein
MTRVLDSEGELVDALLDLGPLVVRGPDFEAICHDGLDSIYVAAAIERRGLWGQVTATNRYEHHRSYAVAS